MIRPCVEGVVVVVSLSVLLLPEAMRVAGPRARMLGLANAHSAKRPMVDEHVDEDGKERNHGTEYIADSASVLDRRPPESIVWWQVVWGGR